jgi:mutator family transposase
VLIGVRADGHKELITLTDGYRESAESWADLLPDAKRRGMRHRTKITRGPGSKPAGLAMAFKLIMAAQDRWRAVNAPRLVALVRAGARFEHGKLIEREPIDSGARAA